MKRSFDCQGWLPQLEVKVLSLGRCLEAGSGGRSEVVIEIGYYKDRRLVLAWWGEAEVEMEWALPPARVVATGSRRVSEGNE